MQLHSTTFDFSMPKQFFSFGHKIYAVNKEQGRGKEPMTVHQLEFIFTEVKKQEQITACRGCERHLGPDDLISGGKCEYCWHTNKRALPEYKFLKCLGTCGRKIWTTPLKRKCKNCRRHVVDDDLKDYDEFKVHL